MKFCKDCKHIESGAVNVNSKCHHPSAEKDYGAYAVTGDDKHREFYAATSMRAGKCTDANLFEAKQ